MEFSEALDRLRTVLDSQKRKDIDLLMLKEGVEFNLNIDTALGILNYGLNTYDAWLMNGNFADCEEGLGLLCFVGMNVYCLRMRISEEDLIAKMCETYRCKNSDYGNAFDVACIRYGMLSAGTRMQDKLLRLINISEKQALVDEKFEDTLLDLANYSVLTYLYIMNHGGENCERKGNIAVS